MTGEPLVEESGWAAVFEQRWAIVTLAIVATLLLTLTNFPWTLDEYDQAKQAFTSFEMVKEGHWLYQDTPNGKVATKSGVRIAVVVLVCATLRLPLHSQQIFNSPPTESASQAPSTKQQIPQEVVQQLEAQLKQVKKF